MHGNIEATRLYRFTAQAARGRGAPATPLPAPAGPAATVIPGPLRPAAGSASTLTLPTAGDSLAALRDLVARLEARIAALEALTRRGDDAAWVTTLYRTLLRREPDPAGLAAHLEGLRTGQSRAAVVQTFLDSPEYRALQRGPERPPGPGSVPREPGAPLATVALTAEHARGAAAIDRSSPERAAKSAAEWVKRQHPAWFPDTDDRAAAYRIMTEVIGVLRAAGYDAHRVVNHPSRPAPDPHRYGADAVVLEGRIFDVYAAFGERNEPTAQDMGPYGPGRLRE